MLKTASDFTNICVNPDATAEDEDDDVVYYDSHVDVPLSILLKKLASSILLTLDQACAFTLYLAFNKLLNHH